VVFEKDWVEFMMSMVPTPLTFFTVEVVCFSGRCSDVRNFLGRVGVHPIGHGSEVDIF
jgi:hypothetical protein